MKNKSTVTTTLSTRSTNLISYYFALEAHDWTHIYSTDHKVYVAGRQELIRLGNIAERDLNALALYVAYSAYVFEGKPKPAVPDIVGPVEISVQQHRLTAKESSKHEEYDTLFLRQFVRELEKNSEDPDLKIGKIAKNLAVSERQLFRRVKSILNVTPSNYLRSFRLEKSLELIKKKRPVSCVAYDVGFLTQSHFSRSFKAKYGTVPSKYLVNLQQ